MAIMVPEAPRSSNKAEKQVFACLETYLPDRAVVYHNKEVHGHEFDFCIVMPEAPILIIEVKGWEETGRIVVKQDVEKVIFQPHDGEKQAYEYPKNQSRMYRFALLKKIRQEYNDNPKIFDVVCFPYISKEYFRKNRLDLISGGQEWALLREDLETREAFITKIKQVLDKAPQFGGYILNEQMFRDVRLLFESIEHIELTDTRLRREACRTKTKDPTSSARNYYSILSYVDDLQEVDALLEEYKRGTKLFLLAQGAAVYDQILQRFQECLRAMNLTYSRGQLRIESAGQPFTIDRACYGSNAHTYHAFNFFITYPGRGEACQGSGERCQVKDGLPEEVEKHSDILDEFDQASGFNFNQYKLEHADTEKHLLVVAGAGTGKTFSMISRLTYLQYMKAYTPEDYAERIAMLTFTNEAADTMKSRLKTCFQNYYMLTRDYAWFAFAERVDSMTISTIHSFSKAILQKHASSLGYGKDIAIVSGDYERKEYIEEALENFCRKKIEEDPGFAAKVSIPVHNLKSILLEILNKLYRKNVSILDQPLDFKEPQGSEMGQIFHDMVKDVLQEAESRYQLQLLEESKIHLNDLINKLRQLMRSSGVDFAHAKMAYLFVDEFQDTDNTQIELIKELQARIGLKYFVVGDVKQCIYRFRGAEEIAFRELVDLPLPPDWQWFPMNKNYRSDRKLLTIYEKYFLKWGRYKKLVYLARRDRLIGQVGLNGNREEEDLFRIIELQSPWDKEALANALIQEIRARSNEIKERIEEGHALKEEERTLAILVRSNMEAQAVYEVGKNASQYGGSGSIFIEVDTGGDLFFSDPSIDLYKLVLALKYPSSPEYLFNLSTSSYFPGQFDLAQLYGEDDPEKLEYLVETINNYIEACLDLSRSTEEKPSSWMGWVESLKYQPVLKILRAFIGTLRPWDSFAASYESSQEEADKARLYYKRNLELVFEKLAGRMNTDYLTLNSLEQYLKIKITTGQEEKAREAKAPAHDRDVRILCSTVHKAKGLEFDTVIMPYGYRRINEVSPNSEVELFIDGNNVGYRIFYADKEAGKAAIVLQNSYYDAEQERMERMREETRILYVAMTRAIRNFTFFRYRAVKNLNTWQGMLKQGGTSTDART